jgi:hypothetical protein
MRLTSAPRISRPELAPSGRLLTAVVTLPPEASDYNSLFAYNWAAFENSYSNTKNDTS